MTRTILHADMDAFYAAIEQRDRPELRGKPLLVGGIGKRGVVCTASYEARPYGARSAMPMSQALRLCPQAIVVPPRIGHYAGVSDQVMEVFGSFTDLVEPLSLDEAFLDVTGSARLFGSGLSIAREIKSRVKATTGLTVSLGVASSKYVAKVASEHGKPDGLVEVPNGEEERFLGELPVRALWGAGKVAQKRFAKFGLAKIADIQRLSEEDLVRLFGDSAGRHFHALSHGVDDRPVVPDRDAKSISHETTFGDDLMDREACHEVLLRLSEEVGRRLRRHDLKGRVVKLKLRYGDFTTLSRQSQVIEATASDTEIYSTVKALFEGARQKSRGVRLLGVGVSELMPSSEPEQLDLFGEGKEKDRRVLGTLDRIRDKFGRDAIRHGGATGEGGLPHKS